MQRIRVVIGIVIGIVHTHVNIFKKPERRQLHIREKTLLRDLKHSAAMQTAATYFLPKQCPQVSIIIKK